ncbi:MAG: WG repeat-containing protein [Crocinitomicaceae bacterium]
MKKIATVLTLLLLTTVFAQKLETFQEGNKVGLKTDFGKELLPPEYNAITACSTDSVDYFIAESNVEVELYSYNSESRTLFEETKNQQFTILQWVAPANDEAKEFFGYDVSGNKFQLVGMNWVEQKVKEPVPCKDSKGKFAVCMKGKALSDYIYQEIRKTNGIIEVRTDSGWIAMDEKMNPMYKWSYDDIYPSTKQAKTFLVSKGEKWGILSASGDYKLPLSHFKHPARTLGIDAKMGQAKTDLKKDFSVKRNGKWGIVTSDNTIKVPFKYENAYVIDPFSVTEYSLSVKAVVKDGDAWSFLNEKYNEHKRVQFDEWVGVHGEFAFVIKNGKVEQLSLKTFETQSNLYFGEYDEYKKVVSEDGLVGVVEKDGNIILPFEFDWLIIEDAEELGFILAIKDGKDGLYSLQGNPLVPHNYEHLIILWQLYEKQFFSMGVEGEAALVSWEFGTDKLEVLTDRKYKKIDYSTSDKLFFGELENGEKVWFDETGRIVEK